MIQDVAPHHFHNEFAMPQPRPQDTLLCFDGDAVLLCRNKAEIVFPSCAEGNLPPETLRYLFVIDDQRFFRYCGEGKPQIAGYAYDASGFREATPSHLAFAGATATQLARWYREHRFCGCCGNLMQHSETERALTCSCGNIVYPKIAPAVIIAVTDGDRLLLTRYAGRPYRRWALVAGYCEVGETVEDTVRREVMEEVGLVVDDLVYYKSQPWPFTDSLLLGFFCRAQGGLSLHPDGNELAEAQWFSRDEIPVGQNHISLTQEMIECFRDRKDPYQK